MLLGAQPDLRIDTDDSTAEESASQEVVNADNNQENGNAYLPQPDNNEPAAREVCFVAILFQFPSII